MKKTNYTYDNKEVSYEVVENGYRIYLEGRLWITQTEPYIPYPNLSYEEGCLKQIEEICSANEQAQRKQDEITEMQLAITELYEMMLGGNE
jgi:hypothetical protein